MASLADEVKALIAMGISPTDALAAVTADRQRNGKGAAGTGVDQQESSSSVSPNKKEVLSNPSSASSSPSKSSPSAKAGSGGSSSRPEFKKPLSYNRPGMIKHSQYDEMGTLRGK